MGRLGKASNALTILCKSSYYQPAFVSAKFFFKMGYTAVTGITKSESESKHFSALIQVDWRVRSLAHLYGLWLAKQRQDLLRRQGPDTCPTSPDKKLDGCRPYLMRSRWAIEVYTRALGSKARSEADEHRMTWRWSCRSVFSFRDEAAL